MNFKEPMLGADRFQIFGLCHHIYVIYDTTRRFLIFECRACGTRKKQRKTLLYRKMLR